MAKIKGATDWVLRLATLAASHGLLAAPAAAELKVAVTIKPVHALVAQVMAGVGTPTLLITGSASPHSYALKPSGAKALNACDVFFRVSEAIEPFTGKIASSLPKTVRVVTLAEAPGIALLNVRTGDTFEAHVHSEAEREAGHHENAHDHDERHARDGHVWLDPENAKRMVAEIARVLAEASPEDAPTLRANADQLSVDIDALETEIRRELAPIKSKPFVVFHDAYQYFERRFDLDAVGSVTVSPEVHPSARRLTEIRRKITALDAKCVFAEPQFQPRLVDAVIEGTGARSGILDPEGALVEPGPGAYSALLRNLASGLRTCLVQGN